MCHVFCRRRRAAIKLKFTIPRLLTCFQTSSFRDKLLAAARGLSPTQAAPSGTRARAAQRPSDDTPQTEKIAPLERRACCGRPVRPRVRGTGAPPHAVQRALPSSPRSGHARQTRPRPRRRAGASTRAERRGGPAASRISRVRVWRRVRPRFCGPTSSSFARARPTRTRRMRTWLQRVRPSQASRCRRQRDQNRTTQRRRSHVG